MHRSKLFYLCLKKLKSSSTWLIPASLCEGPFFYFNVESVFLFLLSSPSKHTVLTLGAVDHIISLWLNMILCIDFIHEIRPWKLKLLIKLASSFVLILKHFCQGTITFKNYQICWSHYFHVFNVLFMKGFCLDNSTWLFIAFLLSTIDNCFGSFHSYPMLYITILIKIVLVACLIKNYFCYHLPTRGRVGVKLGDADTCQTYL